MENIKTLIENEIVWAKEHKGEKGADFENGFIKGLEQALYLVEKLNDI